MDRIWVIRGFWQNIPAAILYPLKGDYPLIDSDLATTLVLALPEFSVSAASCSFCLLVGMYRKRRGLLPSTLSQGTGFY